MVSPELIEVLDLVSFFGIVFGLIMMPEVVVAGFIAYWTADFFNFYSLIFDSVDFGICNVKCHSVFSFFTPYFLSFVAMIAVLREDEDGNIK